MNREGPENAVFKGQEDKWRNKDCEVDQVIQGQLVGSERESPRRQNAVIL